MDMDFYTAGFANVFGPMHCQYFQVAHEIISHCVRFRQKEILKTSSVYQNMNLDLLAERVAKGRKAKAAKRAALLASLRRDRGDAGTEETSVSDQPAAETNLQLNVLDDKPPRSPSPGDDGPNENPASVSASKNHIYPTPELVSLQEGCGDTEKQDAIASGAGAILADSEAKLSDTEPGSSDHSRASSESPASLPAKDNSTSPTPGLDSLESPTAPAPKATSNDAIPSSSKSGLRAKDLRVTRAEVDAAVVTQEEIEAAKLELGSVEGHREIHDDLCMQQIVSGGLLIFSF